MCAHVCTLINRQQLSVYHSITFKMQWNNNSNYNKLYFCCYCCCCRQPHNIYYQSFYCCCYRPHNVPHIHTLLFCCNQPHTNYVNSWTATFEQLYNNNHNIDHICWHFIHHWNINFRIGLVSIFFFAEKKREKWEKFARLETRCAFMDESHDHVWTTKT